MKRISIVIILLSSLIWLLAYSYVGPTYSPNGLGQKVTMSVEELQIRHYIGGCGCRSRHFAFIISIKNNTQDTQVFRFSPVVDACTWEVDTSSVYWITNGKRFSLVPKYEKDSIVMIGPGEARLVHLKTLFSLFGGCLNSIYTYYTQYEPLLNDSFVLLYSNNGKEYIIPQSDSFEITFYLNDTLVPPTDTVRFNKSIPGPPPEILLQEIEVIPEEEAERNLLQDK